MLRWTPPFKLICNTHSNHAHLLCNVGLILIYAMIEKKKADVEWIIYNNIINLVEPTKGLWFLAIITKLCTQFGVDLEKNKERIKVGLAITAMASTDAP